MSKADPTGEAQRRCAVLVGGFEPPASPARGYYNAMTASSQAHALRDAYGSIRTLTSRPAASSPAIILRSAASCPGRKPKSAALLQPLTATKLRGTLKGQRGFSLLEISIALSVAGLLLGTIWQLSNVASQQREAAMLADHLVSVAVAAKKYISTHPETLLALPQLGNLNSVARLRITSGDAGDNTDNLQDSGYLPLDFVNENSYRQSYALFVRREDAGTLGVADASDRLVGLLITTGGTRIPDQVGVKLASRLGAFGGFIYAENNPAPPSAAARVIGTAGGWSIDLSLPGWSTVGTVAQVGHAAALVSLIPMGIGIGGGGGTSSRFDDLEDGRTDYNVGNFFAGEHAGDSITTGIGNTGAGINTLRQIAISSGNTALGANALRLHTSCTDLSGHTALGSNALASLTTGFCWHTAIGGRAMGSQTGARGGVAIGYEAAFAAGTLDSTTAIGHQALRNTHGDHGNTCIGAFCLYTNTISGRNVAVGAYALFRFNVWAAGYTVAIGTEAGYNLYSNIASGARYNTLVGYRAGYNLTTGENNIVIGSNVNAPIAGDSNQINIGNTIYTNSSTKVLTLGDSAATAGIAFDTKSANSSRLSMGTSAQRPVCTASLVGAQRWNTVVQSLEFCNGSAWKQLPLTYGSGTPPEPPVGSGFIVLTQSVWNGNLGGTAGATAKCYNELTSNTNWMYYSLALSRGQLTPAKIVAKMITIPGMPNTAYYFSRAGDSMVGGAAIELDGTGSYSGNNLGAWSGKNYFGGYFKYWTGNGYGNTWTSYQNNAGEKCDPIWNPAFQNGTSAITGNIGYSGATGQGRWWSGSATCDQQLRLMCLVHP